MLILNTIIWVIMMTMTGGEVQTIRTADEDYKSKVIDMAKDDIDIISLEIDSILLDNDGKCINSFTASYIKNYDGDTFTALVRYPNFRNTHDDWVYKKVKVRLHACDTYELRGTRDREKLLAFKAKMLTRDLLSDGNFILHYSDKDRYKRIVADVTLNDGRSLKEVLREQGLLTGKYEN